MRMATFFVVVVDRTRKSKPGEVGAAVEAALKAGYKLIDCAHIYGNEEEVGASLCKCFDDGMVKREDIFITSKLWYVECAIIIVNITKGPTLILQSLIQPGLKVSTIVLLLSLLLLLLLLFEIVLCC